MKCPCYQCPDRSPTCHADCGRYAAFSADRERLRARHLRESAVLGAKIAGIRRNKQRLNLKG